MALPVFFIGSYPFRRIKSTIPFRPKRHFVIETKPGRDGFAAIQTGRWGEPLTLDAESVFSLWSDAIAATVNYQDMPSLTLQTIEWETYDLFTEQDVKYLIQAVEIMRIQKVASAQTGTTIYTPATIVESRWTVIPRFT
jgi:hypothetical protein